MAAGSTRGRPRPVGFRPRGGAARTHDHRSLLLFVVGIVAARRSISSPPASSSRSCGGVVDAGRLCRGLRALRRRARGCRGARRRRCSWASRSTWSWSSCRRPALAAGLIVHSTSGAAQPPPAAAEAVVGKAGRGADHAGPERLCPGRRPALRGLLPDRACRARRDPARHRPRQFPPHRLQIRTNSPPYVCNLPAHSHHSRRASSSSSSLGVFLSFFGTWLKARTNGAPVSIVNLLGMRLGGVPYSLVVDARITAVKAGIPLIDRQDRRALSRRRQRRPDACRR